MKHFIFAIFSTFSILAGCSTDHPSIETDAVAFKTFVGRGTAAPQDSLGNLEQDFGVFVYRNADGVANTSTAPDLLYNEEVRFIGGTTFIYDNTIYWPATDKLGFYAYSPYSNGTEQGISGFFPADKSTPGVPGFQFAVNPVVNNQIDLLVAKTEGRNGGVVPIAFLHALSRVEVQAHTSGTNYRVAITGIMFEGINNSGTYNFTNAATPWTNQNGTATYNGLLKTNGTSVPGGSDPAVVILYNNNSQDYTPVTDPDNALYLLPQKLGANARLLITYNIYNASTGQLITSTSAETKTINLSDANATESGLVEWGRNKRVIYKLNFIPQSSGVGSAILFEATVNDWDTDNSNLT